MATIIANVTVQFETQLRLTLADVNENNSVAELLKAARQDALATVKQQVGQKTTATIMAASLEVQ